MKYFRFYCMQKGNANDEHIAMLNQYCDFLKNMYQYYFKPVKTDGIVCINIYFTENTFEATCCLDEKVFLIIYKPENLLNKPADTIHKILLDQIQHTIIKCVQGNNWNAAPFENAYNKIVANRYLFEKDLKPLSNKVYKA